MLKKNKKYWSIEGYPVIIRFKTVSSELQFEEVTNVLKVIQL